MEFLFGAIAGLGFLWALFWIGLFIVWIICAENESPGIALGLMVVGAVAVAAITNSNPWAPVQFVAKNWPVMIIFSVVYLLAGSAYSFFKWDRYVSAQAQRVALLIKKSGYLPDSELEPPSVFNNKYKFTTWILLWPASLFWWVCSDMLLEIRDFILERFSGIYHKIAMRHYGQFADEIARRKEARMAKEAADRARSAAAQI